VPKLKKIEGKAMTKEQKIKAELLHLYKKTENRKKSRAKP
jgi:hypothetical protein